MQNLTNQNLTREQLIDQLSEITQHKRVLITSRSATDNDLLIDLLSAKQAHLNGAKYCPIQYLINHFQNYYA